MTFLTLNGHNVLLRRVLSEILKYDRAEYVSSRIFRRFFLRGHENAVLAPNLNLKRKNEIFP